VYYYLYDTFLADKKYERILAAIETRLTDLGISGKIGRLTPFTNARGLIRDETKRGAQTIVVVGNDETVAKAVDGIGEAPITLGFIPVGSPSVIAASLGIPEGVDACEVLSKRVTQKIDLGTMNGHFFLSHVRIPSGNVLIEGDGKYRISTLVADCDIVVSNLRSDGSPVPDGAGGYAAGDPMDGWLDALITPKKGSFLSGMFRRKGDGDSSVIPLRKLSVTSQEPIAITADGREYTNTAVSIEIVPDRLKVITGRERAFAA
jgi:diacylglycerol kinase family enzyme